MLTRELACTVAEFFRLCWTKSFYDQFAQRLKYYDTGVTEWHATKKPGALEREVKWTVALTGLGPKSVTVKQTQKARLKNAFHLEIETSGRSVGVPYCDNWTAEERWQVVATATGCRAIVEACVHWTSTPWGAGLLKGTIDEQSHKNTVTNGGVFFDLAAEIIAERRKKGPKGKENRPSLAVSTPAVMVPGAAKKVAPPAKPAPTSFSTPPAAPVVESRPHRAHSRVPSVAEGAEGASPPLLRLALYAVFALLLVTLPLLFHLTNRLNALETELQRHTIDEKIAERVAFLEYFLSKFYANVTKDVRSSSLSSPLLQRSSLS